MTERPGEGGAIRRPNDHNILEFVGREPEPDPAPDPGPEGDDGPRFDALQDGAAYAGGEPTNDDDDTNVQVNRCVCGNHVSDRFLSVLMPDTQERPQACPERADSRDGIVDEVVEGRERRQYTGGEPL